MIKNKDTAKNDMMVRINHDNKNPNKEEPTERGTYLPIWNDVLHH
jgi:hypothetical protein